MTAVVPDRDARLGIEFISVLGLPPPAFAAIAAQLGCGRIGIALEPIVAPAGSPRWSLRDDPALRRAFADALAAHDVSISLGEGFIAVPGRDVAAFAKDLDLMAELGAARVNILGADPDSARCRDQIAAFAALAAARGMGATLEFLPGLPIADLAGARAAVDHAAAPGLGILIDTMHLFRSGGTVADVAALPAETIGYVQLCDVPRVSRYASYAEEARGERLPPGEGDLPLRDLIAALPPHVPLGLEVPMLARAEAGVGPRERLAGSVATVREWLDAMEDRA